MAKTKHKIKQLVEQQHDEVVEIRRHLHANPELSFAEFNTADYIESMLKSMGLTRVRRSATTGVIVELGNQHKPTIYLRADIDALPIKESNEVGYKSTVEGVMHACGHDVHTATLLGVIKVLSQMEAELPYHTVCVFQPGEEKLPGGASLLIKDGLFDQSNQGRMVGNHVHPPLQAGQVGFKSGMYMASADELYLTIKGKGGHGAMPHLTIDPLPIVAEIVQSLQTLVSRYANPSTPTVLTFGKINSVGGATNIIPDTIELQGTFRTFDEKWRFEAHRLIKARIDGICLGYGASANVDIRVGYPTLYNDPVFTEICKSHAIDYLGAEQVIDIPMRTTSEDFAFYSQEVPSCFYRIGTDNPSHDYSSSVHTPSFDVDESCLLTSVGLMSYLAFQA